MQETHFKSKDICRLKVKEWEKIFHTNKNQKISWVAIFILDKVNFKTNTSDKEHYVRLMGSMHHEDITIVHPTPKSMKFIKWMLTK